MWTQSGPRHTMPTPEMMPSPRSITWQHLMALCSHCRAHPTALEHSMALCPQWRPIGHGTQIGEHGWEQEAPH